MARSTPRVDGTVLVGRDGAATTITVDSLAWYAWLEDASSFAFRSDAGGFTARKERSGPTGWYWKAYRKLGGTLYRAYLGKSAELTLERLNAIASDLAGRITEPPLRQASSLLSPAPAGSNGDTQPLPAAPLPTGTLTFLFTDIEGSTQLWEQFPQAMPATLARHDALVRQTIEMQRGVIFKTVGDGMHAVFARAADALAAALAVQRALHAEAWGTTGSLRVRMALHSGAADLRNGDYFGPPLNRVARILALGHGGQILLSHATHDLVADDVPAQITLRALGAYPLKDLTRPEPIFQLVSPDLPSDFPPLRAAQSGPAPAQALSLLTTKLYVPPARAQLVARPRLLAQLDAGLRGQITLLSAPAGFGKTTLVSAWRASAVGSAVPFAWVSLDAADSDPVRFWSYVIAALEMLQPNCGTVALALLQSSRPPPIEMVLTPLLNALSTLPSDAVLVLDDYHLIDAPPIHSALAFLLDHLPPQLHLVLTTRADPPLPLTRLRARAQLTELRASDLRFTADETAAFLTELMGLSLSADNVVALEARTEGWIAGLQLAALAMRDRADLPGFIAAFTGSNHFVVDYLAEEVIDRLPAHLQTFVLQTSVLERLCGPLCDALLGIGDWGLGTGENAQAPNPQSPVSSPQAYSQMVLEELERANLFLVPLDDERRWYRYHHLFAEVLRARLQSGARPAAVTTLHLRASAWYERQILISEAIEYAILARDFERVARLANEHSERVWMRGGLATLLQWLAVLPDAAIEAHPRLALHHALILAVTDHSQLAEQRIAAAERVLQAAPVRDVELLGRAQVVRAGIALLTNLPAEVTIATGTRALELLPERDDHFWRGFAGLFLGMGYYIQAGNLVAAYPILTEAEHAGIRAGDAVCASSAFSHRSIVLEMRGRLHESEQLNRTYLKQASEPAWQGVPLAAYAHLGLGRVLYERNQLAAAHEQILEAIQQLEAWALKRPLIGAYVTLARVQQALGQTALAREVMERAVAMIQKSDLKQTFSQWDSFQMRLAVMQGDLSAVADWVQAIEPSTHSELDPALAFKHITLAKLYLAQRQPDAAQQLLDRLLPTAHAAGRIGQVLEIALLQTLALHAQGQETGAFAALERALILAEPEGYVRTIVDEGAPMAALLAQVAGGKAPVAAYAARLLSHFGFSIADFGLDGASPIVNPKSTIQNLVEPLSARELEILRLIADGQSNQAIAGRLVIAVSTVKRHINNIYGKLAVQSRTQALARARELQLL